MTIDSKPKLKQPTIKDVIQPKKKPNRKYLSREEATARLPVGRPKGAKNNTTIFKEVIREGFEKQLLKDGMKVVEAVVKKALDGDMTAAKLLLDRILPTTKAIDLDDIENSKGFSISVNIGNLELPKHLDKTDTNVIDVKSDENKNKKD
tara:strand:+ start:9050 stop:9496 length:447 start_codon:yes stop_codon:yes gene_type:complete